MIKLLLIWIAGCCFMIKSVNGQQLKITPKSRIIILTDILNEADDSQTLVRFLMYANKMDIEGIIAVSSCHQYKGKNDPNPVRNTVHPSELKKFIEAYGKVRNNLMLHEGGWPSAKSLLDIVGAGPEGFGTRDIGKGKSTSGSKIIAKAILKDDNRPLYIIINGGANCLAQSIIDLQEQLTDHELSQRLKHIRVFDNAGQDNAGAWIAHYFPEIHYRRSSQQVYCFMNQDGPAVWDTRYYPGKAQFEWTKLNIQEDHGPLGKLYPTRMKWKDSTTYNTIEGGGSGNFIGFVNHGLFDPEMLRWGGWGGRFDTLKTLNIYGNQLKWAEPDLHDSESEFQPYYMYAQASDSWIDPETEIKYEGFGVPIYRWRRAYQNDFEARMDWCIQPFQNANHNPVAAIGDNSSDEVIFVSAKPGTILKLNTSKSSDPDGDEISFNWYIYSEAGTYKKPVQIKNSKEAEMQLTIPADNSGKQIHIILEVTDLNKLVKLTDYRRIVVNIN